MSSILHTLAQTYDTSYDYGMNSASNEPSGPMVLILSLVLLVVAVLLIAALWKMFKKAGRPGWAAIVPFYNVWVLAEIAGRPGWFGLVATLVSFVPFVGWIISLIMTILISMDLAVKFGKSKAFGVIALWLFSFVGYPILGFGSAQYNAATPTDTPKFGEPTSGTMGADGTPSVTPPAANPQAPTYPSSTPPNDNTTSGPLV